MRFLSFVVFAFNVGIIIYLIRRWNAGGGKVEFNPAKWSNLNKFFTVPVSLFCVLVLAGTFVMYTNSENELDKMWADREMTRPTAEQMEQTKIRQVKKFEPRKCNSKPDPFGSRCKQSWE